MRINKFIAKTGYASRRKADELVQDGKVTINGEVAKVGDAVPFHAEVTVEGRKVQLKEEEVYYAFNKPFGVISTFDENADNSLLSYLPDGEHLAYAGRLDVQSSGLMILTSDGNAAQKMMSPKFLHEKEYVVRVNKPITRRFIDIMKKGVDIGGYVTQPAKYRKKSDDSFYLTITEGKNRQIRRMCEALGYEVITLRRVRIMNIKLGTLGAGNIRMLTKTERRDLLEELS